MAAVKPARQPLDVPLYALPGASPLYSLTHWIFNRPAQAYPDQIQRILWYLVSKLEGGQTTCGPSYTDIEKHTGLKFDTVRAYMPRVFQLGVFDVSRDKRVWHAGGKEATTHYTWRGFIDNPLAHAMAAKLRAEAGPEPPRKEPKGYGRRRKRAERAIAADKAPAVPVTAPVAAPAPIFEPVAVAPAPTPEPATAPAPFAADMVGCDLCDDLPPGATLCPTCRARRADSPCPQPRRSLLWCQRSPRSPPSRARRRRSRARHR